MCFPKPFISYWIFCKHTDTSAPLHNPPNALFIWFDLFILCLFLPVLWCELNINSISKANPAAKTSFNESKYLLANYGRMSQVLYAKDPIWSGYWRFQRSSKGVPKIEIFLPLKAFRAHSWVGSPMQSSAEREKGRCFEVNFSMVTAWSGFFFF